MPVPPGMISASGGKLLQAPATDPVAGQALVVDSVGGSLAQLAYYTPPQNIEDIVGGVRIDDGAGGLGTVEAKVFKNSSGSVLQIKGETAGGILLKGGVSFNDFLQWRGNQRFFGPYDTDNLHDLGRTDYSWRSGYFGTSIETPSVTNPSGPLVLGDASNGVESPGRLDVADLIRVGHSGAAEGGKIEYLGANGAVHASTQAVSGNRLELYGFNGLNFRSADPSAVNITTTGQTAWKTWGGSTVNFLGWSGSGEVVMKHITTGTEVFHAHLGTGNEKVVFPTGNVGVGTNLPTHKFEVVGDSLFDGSLSGDHIQNLGTTDSPTFGGLVSTDRDPSDLSTTIGHNASVAGIFSTAIGGGATCTGSHNVAIGTNSQASHTNTAVGYFARSASTATVAVGSSATASGSAGHAFGKDATAGTHALAVGFQSKATLHYGIALGAEASAQAGSPAIALGKKATTTKSSQFVTGHADYPIHFLTFPSTTDLTFESGAGSFKFTDLAGNPASISTGAATFAGDVGIGTATPGVRLQVSDDTTNLQMRVGGTESSFAGLNSYIRLQGRNSADTGNIFADVQLDVDNQLLVFNDPGSMSANIGEHPVVIDNTGRMGIGIGLNIPEARLQVSPVNDLQKGVIIQGKASQTAPLLSGQNSAGTENFALYDTGDANFEGNVGIGLAEHGLTPQAPLDVVDGIQIRSTGGGYPQGHKVQLTANTNSRLVVSSGAIQSATSNMTIMSGSSTAWYIRAGQNHRYSAAFVSNSSRTLNDFTPTSLLGGTIAGRYSNVIGMDTGLSTSASTGLRGVNVQLSDDSASIANDVIGVRADVSGGTNTSANRYGLFSKGGKIAVGTDDDPALANFTVNADGSLSGDHIQNLGTTDSPTFGQVGIGKAPSDGFTIDALVNPSTGMRIQPDGLSSAGKIFNVVDRYGNDLLYVSPIRTLVNKLSVREMYNTASDRGKIRVNLYANGDTDGLINISGHAGGSPVLVVQRTAAGSSNVFEARDENNSTVMSISQNGSLSGDHIQNLGTGDSPTFKEVSFVDGTDYAGMRAGGGGNSVFFYNPSGALDFRAGDGLSGTQNVLRLDGDGNATFSGNVTVGGLIRASNDLDGHRIGRLGISYQSNGNPQLLSTHGNALQFLSTIRLNHGVSLVSETTNTSGLHLASGRPGTPLRLATSPVTAHNYVTQLEIDGVTGNAAFTANVASQGYSFRSGATAPTVLDLDDGYVTDWKDTVTGDIKRYVNDGATVKDLYRLAIKHYLEPQTLTEAATVAYDADLGVNATLTLTADRTLGNITNAEAGMSGTLTVIQDATGGWALGAAASMTVVSGSMASIASMGANEVAKIAWETHNGTDFYLWVTV